MVSSMPRLLLDHRYALAERLLETACEQRYQRYQCYHVELGIPVLVIGIRSTVDGAAGDARNFHTCAIQSANLSHGAIPRLRDYFYYNATHFAVFDACMGTPVTTYLAQAGRTLSETLTHALQLCDALDLVERRAPRLLDSITLSPQTLLVRDRWSISLREPDVTRWLFPASHPLPSPPERAYLAPEVLAGEKGDSRSVMYSISAFLYHALAGHPPAEDRQLDGAFTSPMISVALQSLIRKGLEPAPQRRFPSLEAFGIALGHAAYQALPVAARQARRANQQATVQVARAAEHALPSASLQEAR
jgi:serine/threonine protein kinase